MSHYTFYSSPATCNVYPDSKARRSMFDSNLRSVLAFREIGKGHKAMSTFCGFINLSKEISKTQYDKANEKLLNAYQNTCFQSCKNAALETTIKLGGSSDVVIDCQVSVDGTWQKRGHSSLNRVVTVFQKKMGSVWTILCYQKHAKGINLHQVRQITLNTIAGWQTMTVVSIIEGHQALWRVKEQLKCLVAQYKNITYVTSGILVMVIVHPFLKLLMPSLMGRLL